MAKENNDEHAMADNPYSKNDDNKTIVLLNTLFSKQKNAHNVNPYSSANERIRDIKALKKSLIKHQQALIIAMKNDFGHRSEDDAKFGDILTSVLAANYTIKKIKRWMKPSKRHVNLLFQPAKAEVQYQPLGVVGIITPWNYPIFLSLGPLITALAAGNHAIIKMSEYTPATNEVMKKIIAQVFDEEKVSLITGGAEVAAKFSALAFDHIVFTGSTTVGRKVMASAALNLTPVTLELGGKSPVIIDEDIDINLAVQRFIFAKTLNAGQTCVAPDYILCPEGKRQELLDSLKSTFNKMYPKIANNPDYTSIINQAQFDRLQNLLTDAQNKGAKLHPLSEEQMKKTVTAKTKKIPLTVISHTSNDMLVMQEEIFGPLLPIVTYKRLSDAIDYINARSKPLALYIMSFDKTRQNYILQHTKAGGVCINEAAFHVAQDDIPFGGVGDSGMGQYHGKEGFLTLSKAKAVYSKGRVNFGSLIFPPYNKKIHHLIYKFFIK